MVVRVLVARGIGLVICDLEQRLASGGDITGEVQSLALQGENPRSGINWLCLAMTLLKALFCERVLLDFWCCLGGVSAASTRNRSL